MSLEAFLIHHLHLGEPALPDFSGNAEFSFEPEGKPALDQLHCLLDGHTITHCEKQMNMIGHDDEIMNFKFLLRNKRPQHIDKEPGVRSVCSSRRPTLVLVVTKNVRRGRR